MGTPDENWEYLPTEWSGDVGHPGAVFGALVILSAFVSAAVGVIAVLDAVVLWPAAGLAIAAGLLFGGAGSAAIALGYLVGALATGALDPSAGVAVASMLVVGYVSGYLRSRGPGVPVIGRVESSVPRVVFAVVIASIAGGSVMAWGGEVIHQTPFFIAFRYAGAYALAGLVIGLPLWYALRFVRTVENDCPASREVASGFESPVIVASISIVWFVLGTLASVGYRWVRTILVRFPYAFDSRGVGSLLRLYEDAVFGVGGSRIQIVLGGIMGSLLLLTLLDDRNGGSKRSR